MEFDIKPYTGVGPITFGMCREEVRQVLSVNVEPVNKSNEIPADFFRELGIFVFYKESGICEAVEFSGPASPKFKSYYFLGRPYREMELLIKTLDPEVVLNDSGLISCEFGFGLYAPSARKKPDLPIEGVIVFEKGYFQK